MTETLRKYGAIFFYDMKKNGQTRCNKGTASLTLRLLFAHTTYGYKHITNN